MDDQQQNGTDEQQGIGEQGENSGGGDGGKGCAEIFAHDVWINNDGGDPILKAGQAFTMMAEVCNQGPNSSGVFTARFILDGGADSTEIQCPNLDAGQCMWISWPYPQGTTAGDHTFDAYFDVYHEVPCDDQSNNYTSYSPFNIGDAETADANDGANQEYAQEQQGEYA